MIHSVAGLQVIDRPNSLHVEQCQSFTPPLHAKSVKITLCVWNRFHKIIYKDEYYGTYNPDSKEWDEGDYSTKWKVISQQPLQYHTRNVTSDKDFIVASARFIIMFE